MRKYICTGALFLALLGSVSAEELLNFMQCDSDGNGRLTLSESRLKPEQFRLLDTSGNGELSLGEFESLWMARSGKPQFAEQAYGPDSRQRLDLYLPAQTDGLLPLVLWIHGGSWQRGSKDACPVKNLTDSGFAVASLNYRYAQQKQFPAQLGDCQKALRWLRAKQARFGVRFGSVSAVGHSAGGQLALLLGGRGEVSKVVAFGSPVDLTQELAKKVYRETLEVLVGGALEGKEHILKAASPVFQWSHKSAQLLLLHGTGDRKVPSSEAESMVAAAQAQGIKADAIIVPDGSHSLVGGPDAWRRLVGFLRG